MGDMDWLAIPLVVLGFAFMFHGWPKIIIKKSCKKDCDCQK